MQEKAPICPSICRALVDKECKTYIIEMFIWYMGDIMKNTEKTMDKIVALCKGRGFVYAGSEIYGGLANTWDYGPLGVEFKNNIKKAWLRKFVQESPYNVGLDSAILMNRRVWVASGHVSTFNDPLIDCRACKTRHRADKLVEDWIHGKGIRDVAVETMDNDA
jgi:glycyl-tRNA synthetase